MKYLLLAIIMSFTSQVGFAEDTIAPPSKAPLIVEVTNATTNGASVTGDSVTVRIYEHGKLLHTFDGKVAADGKAVFKNVPTGEHIVAVARAKHQNMMFNGRPAVLKPTGTKHLARVRVFDVSYDRSKLSVETHHLIIKARSVSLEITEYMQLKNSSDTAISSKQKDNQGRAVILEVMLPEGFKNLKTSGYFEEDALVVTEQGFYDTMAVPPGEWQATFSYSLDITSNTMNIVKGISLPTANLVIFAQLGQAKLQGLGQAHNQLSTGRIPMKYYKLSNLAPAEKVAFQITGFNVNSSSLTTWVILASTFSAIGALAFLRLRPQKS